MRIFLTGSASCLGRVVLPMLAAREEVDFITGVDTRPTAFAHPKFAAHLLDIRDPGLTALMHGHDAVLHLAFVIKRGTLTEALMHDANVGGGMSVVDAAVTNGIAKFINLSSVSVYGRGLGLIESAPVAPAPAFTYACHKAELERYLAQHIPHSIAFPSHHRTACTAVPDRFIAISGVHPFQAPGPAISASGSRTGCCASNLDGVDGTAWHQWLFQSCGR